MMEREYFPEPKEGESFKKFMNNENFLRELTRIAK
jgi:hypothetical protein